LGSTYGRFGDRDIDRERSNLLGNGRMHRLHFDHGARDHGFASRAWTFFQDVADIDNQIQAAALLYFGTVIDLLSYARAGGNGGAPEATQFRTRVDVEN
jgi:hypothetical protein